MSRPVIRRPSKRKQPGVTLIMVAGVLAILAALGAGFYSVMFMQTKSATRYSDSVRAEFAAKAGIEDAVGKLRNLTLLKTEDPSDPWYTTDYLNGARRRISFASDLSGDKVDNDGDGLKDNDSERTMPFSRAIGSSAGPHSDRYILEISDAASRININACDNLAVVLDNLCRVIGPPLVSADLDMIQPARWAKEGADQTLFGKNSNDTPTMENRDLYFKLAGSDKTPVLHPDGSGRALYGDGYAIAGFRSRNGKFKNLSEVKNALTVVSMPNRRDLEDLEREVKFAAIKDFLTVDSWVDTTTVCVGKFEWVFTDSGDAIAVDRDKSWVASVDENGRRFDDPLNERGSLIGCYVSIMNGHGAGQLRRITDNGTDWIRVENGFEVEPGPISSYMIIAKEDAKLETISTPSGPVKLPMVDANGNLVDDPNIDYSRRPLCIHRAPVNINTASDKVLTALFLGINVQHGIPLAVGTETDRGKLRKDPMPQPPLPMDATEWVTAEKSTRGSEPYLLTLRGLKRLPADSGKPILERKLETLLERIPAAEKETFKYLNNYGTLSSPAFVKGQGDLTEAHELAFRIIYARQKPMDKSTGRAQLAIARDPLSRDDITGFPGYERGPFRSWDDFYFRVVRPWDEDQNRIDDPKKTTVAQMIMAHFNSNTDILKFNPNIEWIDRWGRNFTEMEPVMVFEPGMNEPQFVQYLYPANNNSEGMWSRPVYNRMKTEESRGCYYTRSLRYKADELIDKTDLNRSTTEFSFDSGGIFEIKSVGQVAKGNEVLSERRIDALVKFYDVWRESTQAQFVRGTISRAIPVEQGNSLSAIASYSHSGRVTRDATNVNERLALDTQPEPLVPLRYRLDGANFKDEVSGQILDAYGRTKDPAVPDTVANDILPAQYDGQIVLASNTSPYNPSDDTFLASFDGDLDTNTCAGNGREQAKTPANRNVRVLDTISLLGVLNDREVDFDPKEGNILYDVFVVKDSHKVMKALDKANYWENVTCRMGDLRPDGVFLGNVGISGKDSTLKYIADKNMAFSNGGDEVTLSMWLKPAWHISDEQEHEIFNACNAQDAARARGYRLRKSGKYSGVFRYNAIKPSEGGDGGGGGDNNQLDIHIEDTQDADYFSALHAGTHGVKLPNVQDRGKKLDPQMSPAWRTQPFRWSFVGMVSRFAYTIKKWDAKWPRPWYDNAETKRGRLSTGGGDDEFAHELLGNITRPFIDTARRPENSDFSFENHHAGANCITSRKTDIGDKVNAQQAAWSWADGATTGKGTFGMNNLNKSYKEWLYRSTPVDGTLGVVDELKLSKSFWDPDRIGAEMSISRYYLPQLDLNNPTDNSNCPTFTSQTMLSSLRGTGGLKSDEKVTLARVSWNCFTPRFMHENKKFQNKRKRVEVTGDTGESVKKESLYYRGPFDYVQYNYDILPISIPDSPNPSDWQEKEIEIQPAGLDNLRSAISDTISVRIEGRDVPIHPGPLTAYRPSKLCYSEYLDYRGPLLNDDRTNLKPANPVEQSHASRGIEIEVLDDQTPVAPAFVNPDAMNAISETKKPIEVRADKLRYRVRFLYPIDPIVNRMYGGQPRERTPPIDAATQYLVDTPVFDDISITYFTKVRYLSYKEVSE